MDFGINFLVQIVFPIMAGFLGIVLHTITLVTKPGQKQSLSQLTTYVSDNILTFLYSIISYILILTLWYFEGFELMGLVQGKLTYLTVIVGFLSQQLFDKVVYRYSARLDSAPDSKIFPVDKNLPDESETHSKVDQPINVIEINQPEINKPN